MYVDALMLSPPQNALMKEDDGQAIQIQHLRKIALVTLNRTGKRDGDLNCTLISVGNT